MHPTDEDNRPQEEDERTQRTEPLYHSWLGHPVVISYSRASNWWDFEHPYEISRGAVEGREALFLLEQPGSVGVGVRRILEAEEDREELGELLFVPWGAIHSMYSRTYARTIRTVGFLSCWTRYSRSNPCLIR